MQFSKVSTVALLFATLLGSVALSPAKASAAVVDIHLTSQQSHVSVVNRDLEISRQRALEAQRLAAQKAREQQQRLAEQKAREQQQRLAAQKAREQQQRLAAQKAREQQQRLAAQKLREQQQRLAQYHH